MPDSQPSNSPFKLPAVGSSPLKVSELVRARSLEIGFEHIGYCDATPMVTEFARMQEWLNDGMHATMSYLERNPEKREDPRSILPGVKTVIVVSRNYYTDHEHSHDRVHNHDYGKISRYAWGDDYHELMSRDLDSLVTYLSQLDATAISRRYVDTGPIMEKQWAVRAGIGWQGKHSNIIRPGVGSYFFLGIVLTTMSIESTPSIDDRCGTCTACLDACPTQAIVSPYVVDSRKCLSYWTIETKADVEIPADIRQNADGWIYGCDVCQEVCPWNRFRSECDTLAFQPRSNETSLNLDSVLSLSQEEFSSRFRHSAIKRAKLGGLQRNARALKEYYEVTSDSSND